MKEANCYCSRKNERIHFIVHGPFFQHRFMVFWPKRRYEVVVSTEKKECLTKTLEGFCYEKSKQKNDEQPNDENSLSFLKWFWLKAFE